MLGQIALALLSAACVTDQNDATREANSNQAAIQRECAEANTKTADNRGYIWVFEIFYLYLYAKNELMN